MANPDDSSRSSGSASSADSDSDDGLRQDYTHFIQTLINSGQLHIMTSEYVGDYFYGNHVPKINSKIDTTTLNNSEFSLITQQTCGMADSKRKKITNQKNIANMILNRQRGVYPEGCFSFGNRCRITNRYLPNCRYMVDGCVGKVFCGIFSKDGNCFLTASQDRYLRLYNSGDGSYKLFNSFRARDVGWSIIDVAFSPDRQHFIYSTWSSALHLCSVDGSSEQQEPLSLLNTSRRFCIFSVTFSSDGRELLGGANDGCLYVYDRQHHSRTLRIPAHEYDVNSVVFADDSSHIVYSGGDDGLVKVWDRRTLDGSSAKPVGILAGHRDGVTFVDSRGDGRHLISNSKDQSIKLWDVRVFSDDNAAKKSMRAVSEQTWDYRWQEVPKKLHKQRDKLEGDTSVMTYTGHVVIKTLVRCRFSPVENTGQRYIYTGCGAGRVIVYDALTGQIKESLEEGHAACVRDVSWHPFRNEILSSSWDGMVGKWCYIDKDYVKETEEYELKKICAHKKMDRRRSRGEQRYDYN